MARGRKGKAARKVDRDTRRLMQLMEKGRMPTRRQLASLVHAHKAMLKVQEEQDQTFGFRVFLDVGGYPAVVTEPTFIGRMPDRRGAG